MLKTENIPFRFIPRQSALFLNYLDSSPEALHFYQGAPTMENLEKTSQARLKGLEFPRIEMASILRRQNESFGADHATLSQIAELEESDSVAVLTGQQVGLFGGPLYTIYKAITAINLAWRLKAKGIRAVPIFWMDTEDHDLAEVSHCTVLAGANAQAIDCRKIIFGELIQPAVPVGSIVFPDSIRQAVEDFLSYWPDADWRSDVRTQLESTYKPGASFANSFASLMSRIFSGTGLIFFDPQDSEAKRLSSSLFQKALQEAKAIYSALVQRKHELETAGFHAQVNILENSTVLFSSSDGQRRALERRNSGFGLKGGDLVFSTEELLESAALHPEEFSPNVLLRPLVQDCLFPTVAYVGGSSELAYFAQIETLYNLFGRPMPIIWPRNSFTLIDPYVGSKMDKLGIAVQDCFKGKQFITDSAIRNSGFSKASDRIEGLQKHLDQGLSDMRPELQAFEPPLAQALETARRKIAHNVQLLKSRIVHMETTRNSSPSEAIDSMLNNCYPNRNLQEREFNIHQYLARYGFSLLDAIRTAADPENFSHQVLRLEET
jgi:bacillithiol synthase